MDASRTFSLLRSGILGRRRVLQTMRCLSLSLSHIPNQHEGTKGTDGGLDELNSASFDPKLDFHRGALRQRHSLVLWCLSVGGEL